MSSLAGLVANYGDSDDEHEAGGQTNRSSRGAASGYTHDASAAGAIHPAPIAHCPWSACYDDTSGFTYYWNQQTNAVTWDAPPEYLLALKLAQQQMSTSGSTEVSAEEWQLYQQALAEKQNAQNKMAAKASIIKPTKRVDAKPVTDHRDKRNTAKGKKRRVSEDDDEKIELITSFYNSDSESNDEVESPVKAPAPPKLPVQVTKPAPKKLKKQPVVTYGPSLPPNQNYAVPIGPELPKESSINIVSATTVEDKKSPKVYENDDSQDERILLSKLKDKALLLEKLGGEIPSDLQKIIRDECRSGTASPARPKEIATNIDDLLDEIEKKELPKIKSNNTSARNSPRSCDTPPRDEVKPLFPSSKAIDDMEKTESSSGLFPSSVNIVENGTEKPEVSTPPPPTEKKNMYLSDSNEVPVASRKKFRISNSVLPERVKSETPAYTTKYSAFIEGFSSERTGLGFTNDEESFNTSKPTISYGNGLMFTKGEVLNEDRKEDEIEELMEFVETKLKGMKQQEQYNVTPMQEMFIEMQCLRRAFVSGCLSLLYWRRWLSGAASSLRTTSAAAVTSTVTATTATTSQQNTREVSGACPSDAPTLWDAGATSTDMDICTTPPHVEEETELPPAPVVVIPARCVTPPPPVWGDVDGNDPPPPGCEDPHVMIRHPPPPPPPPAHPPPPPPPPPPQIEQPKQEIGDELACFYSDIAELEKHTDTTPPPPPPPTIDIVIDRDRSRSIDRDKDTKEVKSKKKTKVKISSAVGMKHKSVSNLVAKWQQVAEEINSD